MFKQFRNRMALQSAARRTLAESLETRLAMSIAPFVTESGLVSLTTDGVGFTTGTGVVSTVKPAGATVRKAYLFSATTPSGPTYTSSSVTIDGKAVTFSQQVVGVSSIRSAAADVTSLVKPKIDAAAAGNIDFTIGEATPLTIDGEILAVIYDDPTQTTSNTVVLLFGSQATAGDTFNIGLANPINTAINTNLNLSLGISFGYQENGGSQYSRITVNGTLMTSSAGGSDDANGPAANGNLITVGGLGDSNANPASASALPSTTLGARSDDELYNLAPFVKNGDTSIVVNTVNPSNDDNIFFAALSLRGTTAVVGEGIVLAPATASANVGATVPLTATVQDNNGKPIANRAVKFTVNSGPDAGKTQTVNTDANGKAVYNLVGGAAGVDKVTASFTNSGGTTSTSNESSITFNGVVEPPANVPPTVNAGPDKTITLGSSVTLNGSATDPDSTLTNASYTWSVRNSANVVVASGTGPNITFAPAAVGNYTATLTVNDGEGGVGSDSAIVKVNPVVVPPTGGPSITKYTLVNGDTEQDIMTLTDGVVLNRSTLPPRLNIRADTTLKTNGGYVKFGYDVVSGAFNSNFQTEYGAPYALFGDFPTGDYNGKVLGLGTHKLTAMATTYSGTAGDLSTLNFTVIEGTPAASAVTGFTLVNAGTNADILTITDGITISLASLATTKLNIRANVTGTLESVRLVLDGTYTRVEEDNPYALFGDFPLGDYYSGNLTIGKHTLTATPFSGAGATGTAGTAKTVTFTIIA